MLPGVQLSPPVFTCAVEASEEKHEKKLVDAINSLIKEDPTVHFSSDPDSGTCSRTLNHPCLIYLHAFNRATSDKWNGRTAHGNY